MTTIEEAKKFIADNSESGCSCPVCDQYYRLYRRKLNTGVALFLLGLYKIQKQSVFSEYTHAKEVVKKIGAYTTSRDYSILEYWGFMKPEPNTDDRKRTSGNWLITSIGRMFVENKISVASHALILNGKLVGWSDTTINMEKALGNDFNYWELMKDA